jgi:hypothetical protein
MNEPDAFAPLRPPRWLGSLAIFIGEMIGLGVVAPSIHCIQDITTSKKKFAYSTRSFSNKFSTANSSVYLH